MNSYPENASRTALNGRVSVHMPHQIPRPVDADDCRVAAREQVSSRHASYGQWSRDWGLNRFNHERRLPENREVGHRLRGLGEFMCSVRVLRNRTVTAVERND